MLGGDACGKEDAVGEVFPFGALGVVGCWSVVGEFGKGKSV